MSVLIVFCIITYAQHYRTQSSIKADWSTTTGYSTCHCSQLKFCIVWLSLQDPAASSTLEAQPDTKGESVAMNYKPPPLQVQIGIINNSLQMNQEHDTIFWYQVAVSWQFVKTARHGTNQFTAVCVLTW